MNANWLGIAAAALSVVGFLVSYNFASKQIQTPRYAICLLLGLLATPGLTFALHYTGLVPELDWYYNLRSVKGTELLVVFIGLWGGVVAALLPRIVLIIPFVGVLAFSVVPFIKPFIGPLDLNSLEDDWDGPVCLQSTPSTCGAAALATVLKRLGHSVAEAELAKDAYSYAGGTEAWYLARAAKERGYATKFSFNPGFSLEDGVPALVGVRIGLAGHFIAILGTRGHELFVGDPLVGPELMSRDELLQRYEFTGFHLHVSDQN